MKIGFDAGHGLKTIGKQTPAGEKEWSFNNKVAKAFASEMGKYQDVELKRFDDVTGAVDVPLSTRTNNAKKWGADLYISFHHNGYKGVWGSHGGVETFVYTSKPDDSVRLAELVQPALVKAYGLSDRGIKYSNLHITREMRSVPVVLVEGGFMDSTVDIKKLRDNKVLAEAGKGIARAVASFSKLKLKPVPVAPKPVVKAGEHLVVSGDTLSEIGKKYGITVAELKALNGLKSDLILVGQVLKVKKVVAPKPAPKPVVKPKAPSIKLVGVIKIANLKNFTYIYEKPSDKSKAVGTARLGSTLHIAGSIPDWFEVVHNGKRAYVKDKYAKRI